MVSKYETANGDDSEFHPPPIPGRTFIEKLDAVWAKAWGSGNIAQKVFNELAEIKGVVMRIDGTMRTASLPPMRPELESTSNLEELRDKVVKAAEEGEHDPRKTAAAEVARLFAEEELKREFARLKQAEEASKAAHALAEADKKKTRRAIMVAIIGTVGGTGCLEFAKYLFSLHH